MAAMSGSSVILRAADMHYRVHDDAGWAGPNEHRQLAVAGLELKASAAETVQESPEVGAFTGIIAYPATFRGPLVRWGKLRRFPPRHTH